MDLPTAGGRKRQRDGTRHKRGFRCNQREQLLLLHAAAAMMESAGGVTGHGLMETLMEETVSRGDRHAADGRRHSDGCFWKTEASGSKATRRHQGRPTTPSSVARPSSCWEKSHDCAPGASSLDTPDRTVGPRPPLRPTKSGFSRV